jgi:hypothetical protein
MVLVLALAAGALAADAERPGPAGTGAPPAEKAESTPKAGDEKGGGGLSRINPFAPLVRPPEMRKSDPDPAVSPASEPAAEPVAAPAPRPVGPPPAPVVLKLNGILFSAHMPVAVINDSIAGVGDQVEGHRVLVIRSDQVIVEKDGARLVMTTRCPIARPQTAEEVARTEAEPEQGGMPNAECGTERMGSGVSGPGSGDQSEVHDPQSAIRNPQGLKTGTRDQAPGTRDGASPAHPESEIRNPQCRPWACLDCEFEAFDYDAEAMVGDRPAQDLGPLPELAPEEQARIVNPLAKEWP